MSRYRVLVVEDEMLIAMALEDILEDMGHAVVASATTLHQGLAAARDAELDLALLDVNLGGQSSFPIADLLADRGIPFVFATGYGVSGVSDRHRAAPTLQKPFTASALARALAEAMTGER